METSAAATKGRLAKTADSPTVGRTRSRRRKETAGASVVSHTEAAATVIAFHDIDFAHLWRQMAAAGWTYKRPRGIETEWTYMNPDGSAVLVGESAVMEYAIKSGLLGDNEDSESNDNHEGNEGNNDDESKERSDDDENKEGNDGGQGGVGGRSNDRDDVIRVSQIDTTAQHSQNTLNDLFGTSSDSEVELSQAAVARAFDLSPTELEQHHDAAQSLQLLSEASGMESDSQSNPLPTSTPDLGHRSRRKIKPDVNYIPETESMSAYESYSSGASDDNVEDDNADSDDITRDYGDEQEDALSEDDAVGMDQAFVDSLLLGDDAPDVQVARQRENALRETEWGPLSSGFETSAQAYPGMNIEDARPVSALRGVAHSPLLTLFHFMPKSLWIAIGIETNRYGLQQVPRRAEVMRQKQPEGRRETLKQIRRRLKSKRGYETHEILHVVGLLVARMLCPQQRRFAAHWSMVEDGAVPAGNFGRYISRNRCQDVLRDLHFVDNEADRPRDKLWKLRPIIDKLQHQFLNGWTLPSVFSFDEGVLPATSKRSPTRMFMPDKPHRYGSKLFMTCDSKSAYCHRFEMYAGKRRDPEAESVFDHKTGAAAVVRNLKIVFGSNARQPWHVVVID